METYTFDRKLFLDIENPNITSTKLRYAWSIQEWCIHTLSICFLTSEV